MRFNRKQEPTGSHWEERSWLPDMDLNHDKQIQSLLCYRYTIGQRRTFKLDTSVAESRLVKARCRVEALKGLSVEACGSHAKPGQERLPQDGSTVQRFNGLTNERHRTCSG